MTNKIYYIVFSVVTSMFLLILATNVHAYTANSVWMEFRDNGRYRVYVNYTIPELRQFREVYVDFVSKKEAESYYFDLLKGADFYFPDSAKREFKNNTGRDPW